MPTRAAVSVPFRSRRIEGGAVRQIETDYLVVGAGASGMAFVDSLVASAPDVDVVVVDRRHRPGGHWLDAYPFVRLHQPSANYGVNSRVLGHDRIDETGPNAGYYERATAAEICDYFGRVLDETLLPSGQVRFLGSTDYRGEDTDGHHVVSQLTGEETTVTVRRKVVDATYVESSIPSRHTPPFRIDEGVRLVPPNDLVELGNPARGFTVLGAGKTAMDTCTWLLDAGVDPDRIRWIRPRDPWLFERDFMQPLSLVGSYMQLQARWVRAAAEAEDGADFARRLEADGVLVRVDTTVEPTMFRGAIISAREVALLRSIERVVLGTKVRAIGTDAITCDEASLPVDAGEVFVDCTAAGVRTTVPRPIFEGDRITLQYVTIGIVPWGAATVGTVEALRDDDVEKNRLCPPLAFTGRADDLLLMAHAGMTGLMVRAGEPDLAAWTEACRLNPARGAADHLDDPRVTDAFTTLGTHIGAAMRNLSEKVVTASGAPLTTA
jgi:hypothetical protein